MLDGQKPREAKIRMGKVSVVKAVEYQLILQWEHQVQEAVDETDSWD